MTDLQINEEVLTAYLRGELNAAEAAAVEAWYDASAANRRLLGEIYYILYVNDRINDTAGIDVERSLRQFKRRMHAGRRISLRRSAVRIAAAAVIAAVLLAGGLTTVLLSKRLAQPVTVVTQLGERSQVVLPDGTKVWLNSKSRLEYPSSFGRRSRRVTLCGEGYFEVAHDERKPFVVETGQYDVRVLGTTFNVYAYDNDRAAFETALMEGSVEVSSRSDASQRLVLQPNEAAVMAADGRLVRTRLTDMGRFRWTEGLICLNDVPFGELLERFSDYYDIRILLKNPKLYDVRCTGKFRQSDGIDYSLHVLQRFVNFRYTHDEERHTIEIR